MTLLFKYYCLGSKSSLAERARALGLGDIALDILEGSRYIALDILEGSRYCFRYFRIKVAYITLDILEGSRYYSENSRR